MKKTIAIKGMHCEHCRGAAEKELNALPGVEARVDLKKEHAVVTVTEGVSDDALREAVARAGFEAGGIAEKKGIFG